MKLIAALVKKEFFQIIRDPSSILIAFVLPLILLTIFAYAINLDNNQIKMGLVIEGEQYQVNEFLSGFEGTRYLNLTRYPDRPAATQALVRGDIKAAIILPNHFAQNLMGTQSAAVQVLTDATDPNVALFIASYMQGILSNWQEIMLQSNAANGTLNLTIEPVVWFNPELKSQYFILPGSIAIIMSLVGMILTALVIAREWERGTMEALLTTRATKMDIILAKYISYYLLAMASTLFCSFLCIVVFGVPFRGSFLVYLVVSSLFILTALGQGFIVSTLSKNQFLASIMAAAFGFLPAVILSGFLFEIASMPLMIQWISYLIPARYFVPQISNLYLAGNIWSILLVQSFFLICFALFLFMIVYRVTKERLE